MLAERVKTWTQEWKEQGRQEGETKLLRRQLTRRFGTLPSWAEDRLEQASEAELAAWPDLGRNYDQGKGRKWSVSHWHRKRR